MNDTYKGSISIATIPYIKYKKRGHFLLDLYTMPVKRPNDNLSGYDDLEYKGITYGLK